MSKRLRKSSRIKVGDFYEDCSYATCVCTRAERSGWARGWRRWLGLTMDIDLTGVDLVDGSERGCSARHCAPVKLDPREAVMRVWKARQS